MMFSERKHAMLTPEQLVLVGSPARQISTSAGWHTPEKLPMIGIYNAITYQLGTSKRRVITGCPLQH